MDWTIFRNWLTRKAAWAFDMRLVFEALADFVGLDLHRHAHLDLLTRAWKLRENVTVYDAMYVALAEALEAPIVTCDAPSSRRPVTGRPSK